MEVENEEVLLAKRRKTETNEKDGYNSENTASEDVQISEDLESFLQDYLKKRPPSNLSIYQRVVKKEELEATTREPDNDLKLYRDACADFSDCVAEITEIKASKREGWKECMNEIRKEAAFITLILKKLNRVEKTRTKMSREQVIKERQRVDRAFIHLKNMFCEIQHLRKEIDKCLKFRSKPLGIDLVPVDEFYQSAPPGVSKPEITQNNEHQLQLARLEWELKQRKELAALLNDLENKKSVITEQIDKKEKDLSSLAPLIKNVLVVTQPLKEKLGHSSSKTTSIPEKVSLLPEPLYFLYVQASAYSDACDKGISLEIKGDFIEAEKLKNQNMCSSVVEIKGKANESSKQNLESEQLKLISVHPLSVILKIPVKDGSILELKFSFMNKLEILTVIPELNVPSDLKTSSSEILLQPSNLLCSLYSGDLGLESPNPMNYYQFQKVGLASTFDVQKFGYPYVWAQKLGGYQFCSLEKKIDPKQEVTRMSLPIIIKELKRRSLYRLSLLSLISDIEQGDVIAPKNMGSIKVTCQIKSLKGISWSEYCEHPLSEHFKNSCYISENDIHFKAVITHGEAKLTCLMTVKPDYPLSPCVFAVHLDNISESSRAYNLDIEREVNIYWKELLSSRTEASLLLSYQLFKVMVCFDITVRCDISTDVQRDMSNIEFQESFRGRNRALPFKYLPEENIFVHRI